MNEVKAQKKYPYISDLLRQILMKRLSDDIGMNRNVILEASDPRRLSATIAPIPILKFISSLTKSSLNKSHILS